MSSHASKSSKAAPLRPASLRANAPAAKKASRVQSNRVQRQSSRRLRLPKRSIKQPRSWFIKMPIPPRKPLSKARHLLKHAWQLLYTMRYTAIGIALAYLLASLLLVQGFRSNDQLILLQDLLAGQANSFSEHLSAFTTKFSTLVSTSGSSATPTAGLYQMIVFVICSLALIWAFRTARNKQTTTTKQAFYVGMTPLVPYLIILFIVSLQTLPMLVAFFLYSVFIVNHVAVTWWQICLALVLCFTLLVWTVRMLTASIFALYVVTLPGMTPLRAVRNAKQLVFKRRLLVWRKLMLPLALIGVGLIIIETPFILWFIAAAPWVLFVYMGAVFVYLHAYIYTLYREMIAS